jgi:hypothetical protein
LPSKATLTAQSFLTIGFLLIFAVLLAMSWRYVGSVALGKSFERNYLSRDCALIVAAAQIAPGNLEYEYPVNLSKVGVSVGLFQGNITSTDTKGFMSVYYYALSKGISVQNANFSDKFAISKNSTSLAKMGKK